VASVFTLLWPRVQVMSAMKIQHGCELLEFELVPDARVGSGVGCHLDDAKKYETTKRPIGGKPKVLLEVQCLLCCWFPTAFI
jgi:hypothetical protein